MPKMRSIFDSTFIFWVAVSFTNLLLQIKSAFIIQFTRSLGINYASQVMILSFLEILRNGLQDLDYLMGLIALLFGALLIGVLSDNAKGIFLRFVVFFSILAVFSLPIDLTSLVFNYGAVQGELFNVLKDRIENAIIDFIVCLIPASIGFSLGKSRVEQ